MRQLRSLLAPWLAAAMLPFAASGAHATGPTPWQILKLPNASVPVRQEADGNVSCYSRDGVGCVWSSPSATVAIPADAGKPLICGSKHRAAYGQSGYDIPNHWCGVAYASLYATWTNYKILGFDMMLSKTPEGDTMCRSTDGTTCLPATDAPITPSATSLVLPVVCGPASKARLNVTGYESATNWCRSREIIARQTNLPMTTKMLYSTQWSDFSMSVPDWSASRNPAFIARVRVPFPSESYGAVPARFTMSLSNRSVRDILFRSYSGALATQTPWGGYQTWSNGVDAGGYHTYAYQETPDGAALYASNDVSSVVLPVADAQPNSSPYWVGTQTWQSYMRPMSRTGAGAGSWNFKIDNYMFAQPGEVLEAALVQDRVLPTR